MQSASVRRVSQGVGANDSAAPPHNCTCQPPRSLRSTHTMHQQIIWPHNNEYSMAICANRIASFTAAKILAEFQLCWHGLKCSWPAYIYQLSVLQCSHFIATDLLFVGSRSSDHYFRSVCWFVCLFVCAEFFSAIFDPISIKLAHMLSGSSCVP